MGELNELKHFNSLEELISLNFIPSKFVDYFHDIGMERNLASHGDEIDNIENEALNIYEKLFKICVWFYNNYEHDDFIHLV